MNTADTNIEMQYQADRQRRQQLADIVQQVLTASKALEMSDEQAALRQLQTTVKSDTFKVLVLGEFNTGKSTFINALLGQEILPSYAIPATAIINEIKWAAEPSARLHFRQPDKHPRTISVDDLEEYVVIKDEPNEIRESPFSHLELFWPIELCRNHVEVIDSPGLNESEVREQVTLKYLRKVDTVVFIMTAQRVGPSINEQETLKLLADAGHDELFFVVNQFDLLRREKDQEAVKQRALTQFSTYTKRSAKSAIHFVSALEALEGRTQSDPSRVEASGIVALESVLNAFLSDERSRIKSSRAARELQLSIVQSRRIIPDKRAYLRTPLSELRQRYSSARAQFDQLNADKSSIIRRVDRFQRDIQTLIDSKVRDFFRDIETDVESWADDYNAQLTFNLNVKNQISNMVEDLVATLDRKVGDAFKEWSISVLRPFVEAQIDLLKRDLNRMAEDFEADVRRTRIELLGTQVLPDDLGVGNVGPKNALERILAAAGGFFLMGWAGAGLGAIFGWQEVVDAILPQMMVAFIAGAAGLLPVLPIVMMVSGSIQGGLSIGKIIKRVKAETAKEYKQKLRAGVSTQSQKIAQQIDQALSELSERLEQGLQVQIDQVDEQVKTALLKQEEGQQAVDDKLAEIDDIERSLSDIEAELVEFITLINPG